MIHGRGPSAILSAAVVSTVVSTPASGRLPERPMGADCKSVGEAYEGSNPSPATQLEGVTGNGHALGLARTISRREQNPRRISPPCILVGLAPP